MSDLTAELVRSFLEYDSDTGIFRWKWRSDVPLHWNARYAYTVAGYRRKDQHKHVSIAILNKHYLAHRLAWLYVHGEWPSLIDHINGDTGDNRIANLRVATHSENCMNQVGRSDSKSGLKGVTFSRGMRRPWRARITTRGETIELGTFLTAEAAHAAYRSAAARSHGEFARFLPTPMTNETLESEPDPLPNRGSNQWCAVLTETDIPHIRAKLRSGMSQSVIAQEFAVSRATISLISINKTWRHVP